MNRWAAGRTVDVVCRMLIHPDDAASAEDFEGRTFYFCSVACREKFAEDRAFYAKLAEPAVPAGGVRTAARRRQRS